MYFTDEDDAVHSARLCGVEDLPERLIEIHHIMAMMPPGEKCEIDGYTAVRWHGRWRRTKITGFTEDERRILRKLQKRR